MSKRKDITGLTLKKECCGYIIDGVVIKTFMSKQEQEEANIKDSSPNCLIKCNLCNSIQNCRISHFKNGTYRCKHCRGYGYLFHKKLKGTEWTPIRTATSEEVFNFYNGYRKGVYFWCKCSCGVEQPVNVASLKDLDSTKCKQCKIDKTIHSNVNIGEKYNMLTIAELTDMKTADGHYLIRCECECGNTQYFTTLRELKNGRKSCGCIQRNPNLTEEERQIKRNYTGSYRFRYQVKAKANYTCDFCGYVGHKHDGIMKAHHLNGWSWYDKNKRDNISNGVCLCESCHREFHKLYGYGYNTKEQYEEFKRTARIEFN